MPFEDLQTRSSAHIPDTQCAVDASGKHATSVRRYVYGFDGRIYEFVFRCVATRPSRLHLVESMAFEPSQTGSLFQIPQRRRVARITNIRHRVPAIG
jgi:hypothetical protein